MEQQSEKVIENSPNLEPQSDILLVLDKEESRIEGVKGVDEHGKLEKIEPKKSNLSDFMRVDKGDAISNFFSNFWRRLNDPMSFRFFKAPAIDLDEIVKKLQAAIDNPTPEGNKLLDALELKYYNKLKQEEKMAKTQETKQEQEPILDNQNYKFDKNKIDWKVPEWFGITQELLEQTGQLDGMLKGYKTNRVFELNTNIEGSAFLGDVRLSLRQKEDKVHVMFNAVRYKPNIEKPFYGHNFTEEDKRNLLETGNMGRQAIIENYSSGEKVRALLSLDRFTGEVVSFPQEWVKVPDEFGGVKLSDIQKQILGEGRPAVIEGMLNSTSGELFNKTIQFSADERKFVFIDDGKKQAQNVSKGIPDKFRGRELSEKEKELLEKGKTVYLKNLLTNDKNRLYSGTLSYNKETGDMHFEVDRKKQTQENKSEAKGQRM